jgi:adenine phosphoribosyltransferase
MPTKTVDVVKSTTNSTILKPCSHDQAPANGHMPLRWCRHLLYPGVDTVEEAYPMTVESRMQVIEEQIRIIEDFPKPGILFRDITTLLKHPLAMGATILEMKNFCEKQGATVIAGVEARGFIFGTPVAQALELPFIPIRKAGKLPRETVCCSYQLEYGEATIELHKEDVTPDDKVVIIDDLLATGGTLLASASLFRDVGASVIGCSVVINLDDLGGRSAIENAGLELHSILTY